MKKYVEDNSIQGRRAEIEAKVEKLHRVMQAEGWM